MMQSTKNFTVMNCLIFTHVWNTGCR